jgi:hypothetical protein
MGIFLGFVLVYLLFLLRELHQLSSPPPCTASRCFHPLVPSHDWEFNISVSLQSSPSPHSPLSDKASPHFSPVPNCTFLLPSSRFTRLSPSEELSCSLPLTKFHRRRAAVDDPNPPEPIYARVEVHHNGALVRRLAAPATELRAVPAGAGKAGGGPRNLLAGASGSSEGGPAGGGMELAPFWSFTGLAPLTVVYADEHRATSSPPAGAAGGPSRTRFYLPE